MVTLTLMTTADSGVPADWARAMGGAANAARSGAASASLRIAFRIASLHHEGGDGVQLFNIHAMQRRIRQKVRRMAGPASGRC